LDLDTKEITTVGQKENGEVDKQYTDFKTPFGIVINDNNDIFFADKDNHRIIKISADRNTVTTIKNTSLKSPAGLTIDPDGNIYVADKTAHVIHKISADTLELNILAGTGIKGNADGSPLSAQFYAPSGIAMDTSGNLFVADSMNHTIRVITNVYKRKKDQWKLDYKNLIDKSELYCTRNKLIGIRLIISKASFCLLTEIVRARCPNLTQLL